jgi:hypothetical protein
MTGIERSEVDEDCWMWGEANYTVKDAYFLLIEEEGEECEWIKDVWSPLIPTKMSTFVWKSFYHVWKI